MWLKTLNCAIIKHLLNLLENGKKIEIISTVWEWEETDVRLFKAKGCFLWSCKIKKYKFGELQIRVSHFLLLVEQNIFVLYLCVEWIGDLSLSLSC